MSDNTYEYFCNHCGRLYRVTASTEPTQCVSCSSTDIQNQYRRNNYIATTDPTVNDDVTEGYCLGSEWINTSTPSVWKCVVVTEDAAVWKRMDNIIE